MFYFIKVIVMSRSGADTGGKLKEQPLSNVGSATRN